MPLESEYCLETMTRVDDTSNLFPVIFFFTVKSRILPGQYLLGKPLYIHYTCFCSKDSNTDLQVLNYLSWSLFVAITEYQRLDASSKKLVYSDCSPEARPFKARQPLSSGDHLMLLMEEIEGRRKHTSIREKKCHLPRKEPTHLGKVHS